MIRKHKKIITMLILIIMSIVYIQGVIAIGDVNVELGDEITSTLGGLEEFTERVGENISITFRQMANFLKFFQILFYNLYFFIVFLLFIALIAVVFYLPIKLYPIYTEWKRVYGKKLKLFMGK